MNVDITDFIKLTLDKKGAEYVFNSSENRFFMKYKYEDITLGVSIYPLSNGRIYIHIPYPFRVERNVFAILALYISEYNYNRAFGTVRLTPDGVLSMDYTYTVLHPSDCNGDILKGYIDVNAKEALRMHKKLKTLCDGPQSMSHADREFYRKLLRMGLDRIYDNKTEGPKMYGTKALKKNNTESETNEVSAVVQEVCDEADSMKNDHVLLPFSDVS